MTLHPKTVCRNDPSRHKQYTIELATGTLHLALDPGAVPLHRLLGFALRSHSQRPFLFVSKLLGKHHPVAPRLMRWSYRALARQILPSCSAGQTLCIGMAETATGLGYGVFATAHALGLTQGWFLQTTRYHLAGLERLNFAEAHSHARDFFLYYPRDADARACFAHATNLVLIDDEISTGLTFLRLIQAYRRINPTLQRVLIVSLVNFADAAARDKVAREADVPVSWLALRTGHWQFTARSVLPDLPVQVVGNGQCKKALLAWPGRLGIREPLVWRPGLIDELLPLLRPATPQRPVLVLGTGECNAPAILLAGALEQRGWPVRVQSTTRSPIHLGHAIHTVWRFQDNYGDTIDNFLYNMRLKDYSDIVLCHETPIDDVLHERLRDWDALSAHFELLPQTPYATLHFCRS